MSQRIVKIGPAPRIAVEVAGHGPLVILLHGIGGNRKTWYSQFEALAAQFTVAAWDARGYGDSDDYDGALAFEHFAQDLGRVLDAFGVAAAHLVGVSMGGRIALDFYARWPERVATLTLADTSAGSTRVASPEQVEKFLALRKLPLLEGKTPRDIAVEVAATLVGPGTGADAHAQIIASLAELHRESYLKTLDTVTRFNTFPSFEQIGVPCLVMVGEYDRIATPEYAADMAKRIPGAIFTVISGGSHISNMDRPVEFNRQLLEFLSAHARCGDAPTRVPVSAEIPAPSDVSAAINPGMIVVSPRS